MNIVVFCGPTLTAEDLARYGHISVRPPVRQGELYAAAREKPKAIGIIDGYFDGVPAVWHKEILWALATGIAVFGASSMGALRAAELCDFGMRGIGKIFEDFRDERLTDDDEVALLHGPSETGYLKLSEPMVNVRATLGRAVAEDILSVGEADEIAATAKKQFYQERTWTTVLAGATRKTPSAVLRRFASWLPGHQVDQKRKDALALLQLIDDFVERGERQPPPSFSFEWTETWANAPWLNAAPGRERKHDDEGAAILDELRLEGEAYVRMRRAALLQVLANDEVARTGARPARNEVARSKMQFRSRRAMTMASAVRRWAEENDIDAAEFDRLMADRAGLEALARDRDAELQGAILDQLRLKDAYQKLRRRARAKARSIAAGGRHPKPPPALVGWYFETRLKTNLPDDLADYAAGIGLRGLDDFYALIAADHAFALARTRRKRSGPSKQ